MTGRRLGRVTTDPSEVWARRHGFGPKVAVPKIGRLHQLTSRTSRRSGVYLLHFANGDHYVGRAKDVISRLGDHRLVHEDLRFAQFLWTTVDGRIEKERELIRDAEAAGLRLRNIVGVTEVISSARFDSAISPALQEQWLDDPGETNQVDDGARPVPTADQLRRYVPRFAQLEGRTDAGDVVELLRTYLMRAVPLPRRTEHDFWSVSCLPSTNRSSAPRLFCVNVAMMEALVLLTRPDATGTRGFLVVASDDLTETPAQRQVLRLRHSRVTLNESHYDSAGIRQVRLLAPHLGDMQALLDDPAVSHAAGVLAHRAMQKRTTIYGRYHCWQLAEAALDVAQEHPLRLRTL